MVVREILPDTPVFGVAFSDGSCGCWTASQAETRMMARACREIGLTVSAYLTVRMKNTILIEELA